jgi:hypothetical protein
MAHFRMELSVVSSATAGQSAKTLFLMYFAESRKLIALIYKRRFMDEHYLIPKLSDSFS